MSLKLSITTDNYLLTLVHGKFQTILYIFAFADPVLPLDPGCHFDIMCGYEKKTYTDEKTCRFGGGDIYIEINYTRIRRKVLSLPLFLTLCHLRIF